MSQWTRDNIGIVIDRSDSIGIESIMTKVIDSYNSIRLGHSNILLH